jgi:two-component system response regulator AtoC
VSKTISIFEIDGFLPCDFAPEINSLGWIADHHSNEESFVRSAGSPQTYAMILGMTRLGAAGLNVLSAIKKVNPAISVVLIVSSHQTRLISEGSKLGAAESLMAPVQTQDLIDALGISSEAPNRALMEIEPESNAVVASSDSAFLFSSSAKMQQIWEVARMVSRTDVPVLIVGESGVGKEVLARYIHRQSNRGGKPPVKVNCAALPHDLLESELFGYERGAFTGAVGEKPGKFEMAHKGCILLDEIGEMTPGVQAKLLHVLEDREYCRLGGKRPIKIDVRVLALTNRNLEEAVPRGEFRGDLYFRLNVIRIKIPPLRERKEDIVYFCNHFLTKHRQTFGSSVQELPAELMQRFLQYDWPGNIRQLENTIKRYLILPEIDIDLAMENEALPTLAPRAFAAAATSMADLESNLLKFRSANETYCLKSVSSAAAERAERELILHVLEQTNWNRTHAAQRLNICYRALLNKLKKWQIDSPKAS